MRRRSALGAVEGRLKSALQLALHSALQSVLLLASVAVAACTATSGSAPVDETPPEPAGVSIYLDDLRELSSGDPAVTAEIIARAREAYEDAATTTNRLRLALVLGQPGHPTTDALEAQGMLIELLATPESLLPDERALATIHLQEIEERLILEAENRRLHARIAEAANQRDAETEQRLRNALDENRRLREALDEAESKLEAVTSIERSIRDRGQNNDQNGNGGNGEATP
ncbi:MAG: hypothetical protein ACREVN_06160 [Gammaproteobacteria bacterium]